MLDGVDAHSAIVTITSATEAPRGLSVARIRGILVTLLRSQPTRLGGQVDAETDADVLARRAVQENSGFPANGDEEQVRQWTEEELGRQLTK